MNFIKRALLSVWKHKVKNLVLLIVFSVITALAYIGICIPSAAKLEVDRAKATVGAEVTVSMSGKKVNEIESISENANISSLNLESMNKLLNLKHVKNYNYVVDYFHTVSFGFDTIGDKAALQAATSAARSSSPILAKRKILESNLAVYGAKDVSQMDQFLSGGYSLYSGRFVDSGDTGKRVVMISKDVADKNKLKLGDKIKIREQLETSTPIEFAIVGIFKAQPLTGRLANYFNLNPVNHVFVPYDQVGLLSQPFNYQPIDANNYIKTVLFFLDDPANTADFIKQAKALLPSYYDVQSNNDLYNTAVAPLESVSKTTQMLELLIILAGCIIISLIIAIFLRGRNYEYGVLLAIGEKRIKIVGQTVIEVIIPVALAFCIGIATGTLASRQISAAMLNNEIKAEQQQQDQLQQEIQTFDNLFNPYPINGGSIEKSRNAVPIQNIDISLTAAEFGSLAGVSLLIVLISVIIPCVSILRYQPRRILAARK